MKTLENIASVCIEESCNAEDKQQFIDLLKQETNINKLKSLVEVCTPYTQVTIPILEKILELKAEDVESIILLGWALWSIGEDDAARGQLKLMQRLNADSIEILLLEAALTPNYQGRIQLYKKILEKDPNHKIALNNLEKLKLQGNNAVLTMKSIDQK